MFCGVTVLLVRFLVSILLIDIVKSQTTAQRCTKGLSNTDTSLPTYDAGCSITWSGGGDPYPLKAVYFSYPPYIYEEGGTTKGILVDLFYKFLRQVCNNGGSWNRVNWQKVQVSTMNDLIVYCKGAAQRCHFAMPLVSFVGDTSTAGLNTAKIHSFPGFALIRHKVDQVSNVLRSLSGTFKNLWPIFYIAMAGAFFSGYIVWLLERTQNEEDFPKTFRHGCYEGFWWAYISMTTVGYGDKAPITILGRVFALFWILFGIALIAVITSLLSNAITEGTAVKDVEIRGNSIACLNIMPAAKAIIQINGGTARCSNTLEEVERDFALGYVAGILMDINRLQYFSKERFKTLDPDLFVYQSAVAYGTEEYSMGFWDITQNSDGTGQSHSGSDFRLCMGTFQAYNKADYKSEEETAKEGHSNLLDPEIISTDDSGDGVAVLDPESDDVIAMILYITLMIFLIIMFGLAYDLYCHHKDKHRNEKRNEGYVETEKEKASNHLDPEERGIVSVIDRAMRYTEEKMQETEKDVKNEIAEMSRLIRRELANRRKQDTAYPPLPMNNLYPGYPGNYPYRHNSAVPMPNNFNAPPATNTNNMAKPKSFKNMSFQY